VLRFAVRFWRALDLTFDQARGKRCATAPLLRKLRAPSVIETDSRKAWRALRKVSASTEDLRSLISPRREIRSRKSECLGRAVSLSPRRSELLRRPTGPLVTPCSGLPEVTLHRECRAFFYRLLCLTLKRQAEDKWLDHTRPTGFPWGEMGPQRPETTST
jgi:hypothetical protein